MDQIFKLYTDHSNPSFLVNQSFIITIKIKTLKFGFNIRKMFDVIISKNKKFLRINLKSVKIK